MLYFKKPPKDWAKEEAKGTLDVQSDVVELILWKEVSPILLSHTPVSSRLVSSRTPLNISPNFALWL
jgi:hypothetical protein